MAESGHDLADACRKCGSYCCTYYALPLDEPEDKNDYDDLRWFLMHEGNYIYIEDGDWYLNVMARCGYLLPSGRCAAYRMRPRICREHGGVEDPCEYYSEYTFEKTFLSPEEIEKHAVAMLGLDRDEVEGWFIHEDEGFWSDGQ
ncbi:MAG: YkgJ family cysteine cluster protein [Planctomycetes bacterium]|nr:YkgJ family cysteine cluster protein [Planctomycetota bacterium]